MIRWATGFNATLVAFAAGVAAVVFGTRRSGMNHRVSREFAFFALGGELCFLNLACSFFRILALLFFDSLVRRTDAVLRIPLIFCEIGLSYPPPRKFPAFFAAAIACLRVAAIAFVLKDRDRMSLFFLVA